MKTHKINFRRNIIYYLVLLILILRLCLSEHGDFVNTISIILILIEAFPVIIEKIASELHEK